MEKRFTYDSEFKRKVILCAEEIGNRAAGKQFSVSEANVRRWRTMKNKLFQCKSTRKSFSGPNRGHYPEIDAAVLTHFKELRAKGFPVTREALMFKAKEIAENGGIQFKASRGWCEKFIKRQCLSLHRRTADCRKLPFIYEDKLQYQRYSIHPTLTPTNPAQQQTCNGDGGGPSSDALAESESIICKEIKTEPIDVEDKPDDLVPEDTPYADDVTEDPLKFDSSTADNGPITDNSIPPNPPPKTDEDKNYIDEDKAFLMSLLPAMKELNGQQKMEFKMAVLDSLRRIKYPTALTSSNNVRNVTVLPIKNIQDLNNLGPLISVRQPPLHIKKQNTVNINTGAIQEIAKPVDSNISSQKREPSKRNSGKPVQRRQPKSKASSEPVSKRQKTDITTETSVAVDQNTSLIPPIGANPTTLKFTQTVSFPSPETLTTQAMTSMRVGSVESSNTSATSLRVEAPPKTRPTSSKTTTRRRTYGTSAKNTEPQTITDPLSSTQLPTTSKSSTNNTNISETSYDRSATDEPLESEIDVDEIKLEFVKVEPYADYEDFNTDV